MLETALIGALVPAGIDILKTLFGGISQYITRKAGGVIPTSIDEVIQLENSNVTRLEALAKLDNPFGTPTQWVVDLRASFRYIAAALFVLGFLGNLVLATFVPAAGAFIPVTGELAAGAASFIFGERMLLNFKK
jgi:small basic protein